ncbi:MAG: pyruvate kinase [Alphaproteobacteria bacterium]|nr:pyruvate kinase [Alphaproteobacteria bacterium]
MRLQRQTKILATLGPASATQEQISDLFEAGVDVFRLNFSHGDHETHRRSVEIIRAIEQKAGRPIGILADMQGPKLRIGTFKNGSAMLEREKRIKFDSNPEPGDETRVFLPHPEVMGAFEIDGLFFLDDGKVRCRIREKGEDAFGPYVIAEVRAPGKLSDRKGFNVPEAYLPIPALTDKDRRDLAAALDMGVDWIAQSFVQTPEDVREALALIKKRAKLMVKLEKPAALTNLEAIVDLADGVMLARGDLGVEIPPEDVPPTQKKVVRYVRSAGKPIVVATQMLESMITSSRPTRAEASDVANAVYDGADAVMLSAETAAGEYPVRSVEMMNKICRAAEADETYGEFMEAAHPHTENEPSDAIATAAYYVAQDIRASAIVTYTMSGSTALRMARQRPDVPILCLTPNLIVARQLCVAYGVRPVHDAALQGDFSGPVPHACRMLEERGLAEKGALFVMTAGVPFGVSGTTNILRIAEVE